MAQPAGWESLPRPAVAVIGVLAAAFALPFVALTALSLYAVAASLSGAEGGIVPSIFAAFLAGLISWALCAVAWRMLRVAFRGPELP